MKEHLNIRVRYVVKHANILQSDVLSDTSRSLGPGLGKAAIKEPSMVQMTILLLSSAHAGGSEKQFIPLMWQIKLKIQYCIELLKVHCGPNGLTIKNLRNPFWKSDLSQPVRVEKDHTDIERYWVWWHTVCFVMCHCWLLRCVASIGNYADISDDWALPPLLRRTNYSNVSINTLSWLQQWHCIYDVWLTLMKTWCNFNCFLMRMLILSIVFLSRQNKRKTMVRIICFLLEKQVKQSWMYKPVCIVHVLYRM